MSSVKLPSEAGGKWGLIGKPKKTSAVEEKGGRERVNGRLRKRSNVKASLDGPPLWVLHTIAIGLVLLL